MRKLTTTNKLPEDIWLIMERGAANRFTGRPHDTAASILSKPFFDMRIIYYFSRQDFHPAPSADIVLLHLSKKEQPDIPASERKSFEIFVKNSLKYGINIELTNKQIATSLKLAKLPGIKESGTVLYVQWLCLFRCRRQFYGG